MNLPIRLESTLRKFIMVWGSLLFTFVVAELFFRTYGVTHGIDLRLYAIELTNPNRLPSKLFIPDPLIEGKLNPATQVLSTTSDFSVIYSINTKGLRDKEYPYERTPGKIRILAFGDSNTFGEGVPYGSRFTDIPEEKRSDIEILNFGIPGEGLDKIFLQLITEGVKYRPDYVFVFLDIPILNRITYTTDQLSGDIPITRQVSETHDESGATFYLDKKRAAQYQMLGQFDRSYLLSYLWYRVTLLRLKRDFAAADKRIWAPAVLGGESSPSSEISEAHMSERNAFILQNMSDACKKIRCTLVVFNTEAIALPFVPPGEYRYVDLSSELSGLDSSRMRFTYDPHYTPYTHAAISAAVLNTVNKIAPKTFSTQIK